MFSSVPPPWATSAGAKALATLRLPKKLVSKIAEAMDEADSLSRDLSPRAALAEWLVLLTWRLRIWHDLPTCLASALQDGESPMRPAYDPLLERTGSLLDAAKAAGEVAGPVAAGEVYELVLALSWAVDRFHDDEAAARRRVTMATAGIFTRG